MDFKPSFFLASFATIYKAVNVFNKVVKLTTFEWVSIPYAEYIPIPYNAEMPTFFLLRAEIFLTPSISFISNQYEAFVCKEQPNKLKSLIKPCLWKPLKVLTLNELKKILHNYREDEALYLLDDKVFPKDNFKWEVFKKGEIWNAKLLMLAKEEIYNKPILLNFLAPDHKVVGRVIFKPVEYSSNPEGDLPIRGLLTAPS